MNILIITNFFYPKIHIASFRMEAYAKYLCLAGHSVYVLAEGDSNETIIWEGCNVFYIKGSVDLMHLRFHDADSVFWHKIKAGINYINGRIFLDKKISWQKRVLRKSEEIMKEKAIDVVLSTYGYLAPHLIALEIKKNNPKIRWIADFRDEMSTNHLFSKMIRQKLRRVERKILDNADLIVSVSKPIIEDLKKNSSRDNFLEINNGYDFEENKECLFQSSFTLSYIGSFYGSSRPDNLLHALKDLKEQNKLPSNFILKIVGNQKPLVISDILRNNVFQKGRVSHEQAINEMVTSDVLLIISPSLGRKGVYTGKIFEYLAINRNILALVDINDVAAELIGLTNSGMAVDNSDINNIKKAICILYEQWKERIPPSKKWELIKEFSRKNQVQKLLNYLGQQW
ncbi:hypothetical protein AGMMS49579_17930 [Spirochaetia bacterium]|nr:hypothetical protein AGMMS49579_17930 [Spirochaetia bacterium]